MAEAAPALHDLDAAAADQVVGRARVHLLALEQDGALGDLAALAVQQVGDCLERGGLAGAVGAEQRHDAAGRHFQRDALQNQDDVAVHDLDVVDDEDRLAGFRLRGGGDCHRALRVGSTIREAAGAASRVAAVAISSPSSSRAA